MKNPFKKISAWFQTKVSKAAAVMISIGHGGTIWPPRDYENFAKEVYLKNIIGFRCIIRIAMSCASVEWKLFKGSGKKRQELEDHPYLKMVQRANPQDSWNFLILKAIAFLMLDGNSYIERVGVKTGPNMGQYREWYVHRPDRMKIHVDPELGQIDKYIYSVESRKTEWDVDVVTGKSDILHLLNFHPLDDWYGAAITESAATEIDTHNAATKWGKNLLDNNCRPGMLYTIVGGLSDVQMQRLKQQLEAMSGPDSAGKSLIMEGASGTKAEPYGFSPAEVDFIETKKELARSIAWAWGVPPQLVGIVGDSTYANYAEALLDFWENTVFYYLNYLRDELNNWMFPRDGEFPDLNFDYDIDAIPALAPRRAERWKMADESDELTVNEKRELKGYDSVEGGDIILVPAQMIPLEMMGKGEEEEEEEIVQEEEEAIRGLIEQGGYDRAEARRILGLPEEMDDGKDNVRSIIRRTAKAQ